MDTEVALQMYRIQELAREDEPYRQALLEFAQWDLKMRKMEPTLTRSQWDTILMYCGVLAELSRYQMIIACEISLGKR